MKLLKNGFSLLELMVILALSSMLLTIAIPGFGNFLSKYRLTATSNDFLSGITLTRNEAIRRGRRVDMVPIGGDWHQGWTIFVDTNNDQIPDASEEIIAVHGPVPESMTLIKATASGATCNASTGPPFKHGGKIYITYTGTGYARLNSGGFLAGSMQFRIGANFRCLIINSMGRPRITRN